MAASVHSASSARGGTWEPLPSIIYGFATAALTPFKTQSSNSRLRSSQYGDLKSNALHTLVEENEADPGEANAHQATLHLGDEVYAFEKFVPDTKSGAIWYRGYVVTSSQHPSVSLRASESLTGLTGIATTPPVTGAIEEPQVSMGIFPASHIHVRDELPDAEGRLAEVYSRMINGQLDGPRPLHGGASLMETLREEDEGTGPDFDQDSQLSASTRPRSPRGPRAARSSLIALRIDPHVAAPAGADSPRTSAVKPPPPWPSLKSSDETASGAAQPLIDEIASALREWHSLMFVHLQQRDYRLFNIVKDHIQALHLGRRQLLTQTLSAEETLNLRRDCVARLVRGNIAQNLDVIVRHPTWGGLVTVDIETPADPRTWVSAIRMYAMQSYLAYIDIDTANSGAFPKSSALSHTASDAIQLPISPLTTPNLTPTRTQFGANGKPLENGRRTPPPTRFLTPTPVVTPPPVPLRHAATFYHVYLDLRAFVASPCAPGETAEVYFSLYNKNMQRFLTEEFCAVLNHNGVLARETGEHGQIGHIRTLFRDLGERDAQDSIFLVCRIVRNGAMKMGSIASSGAGAQIRGSEAFSTYNDRTEAEDAPHNARNAGVAPNVDSIPTSFRRPFGAAVLELSELRTVIAEQTETSAAKEHSLPIFVPVNEATYSTLHQDLIASKTSEFEQTSRAQMLAVIVKVFHGEAETIIKENPSLLQDVPITSRLGFPDVVFPGDTRNEVYIKLWSGEFFLSQGGVRIRRSVASFTGTSGGPCNVQVSVEVRTRAGAVVERAISPGTGEPPMARFHSMVFHRNNAPTYGELIKLVIPVDLMQQCHLFFTFRHRSSKEKGSTKPDPNITDKPFAYAYLPLFPDGRAFVQDGSHTLVLYRADKSSWSSAEEYFGVPAILPAGHTVEGLAVPSHLMRSAQPIRDSLVIRSHLCSTEFTQNSVLLGLLSWENLPDKRAELETVLSKFTFVGEVEIVKFLRSIFDSLFAILVSLLNENGELDDLVFNALVTVLGIVQDRRFKNFQPVLDVYIEKHFTCAAASSHMIRSMNRLLANPTGADTAVSLRNAFKVWHYVFKFIIRARELQKAREVGMGTTSEHLESTFKREVSIHLGEVNKLMAIPSPSAIIGTQTIALQQFTTILPDLARVFTPIEVVAIAAKFAEAPATGKGKIVIWKLIMYLHLVRGFLFDNSKSRALLVEHVITWIKPHFGRYDEYRHTHLDDLETTKDSARIGWLESIRLCITIMAVMLDKLQQVLIDPTVLGDRRAHSLEVENVENLLSLFPRLLESYHELHAPANLQAIDRVRSPATMPAPIPIAFPSTYPFSLIANSSIPIRTVVNGVLRETTTYFNSGLGEAAIVLIVLLLSSPRKDIISFLDATLEIEGPEKLARLFTTIFSVATSILGNEAFPSKWLNVNILAHKVILKLVEPIASLMIRNFIPEQPQSHEFNQTLWYDYFFMMLKLLSSPQLVIEEFSPQKRRAVWRLAGDIRGEGASILLKSWEALGWPEAALTEGSSQSRYGGYQVALIDLVELVLNLCLSHHDQLRTNAVHMLYSMIISDYHLSGDFARIETELINKLDELFMSETRADDISRAVFVGQLRSLFELSAVDDQLRVRVSEFLDSVDLFLELLLSVRELPDGDEYQDDRVIATLRLMNFIRRIGRDEIYIKYVHQLVNMHIRSQNYVEAALTLKLHSDLYDWDLNALVDPMPELDLPRQSAFVRKETLCLLVLDYLGRGKAWESAVEICEELAHQHKNVTYNYNRLAEILAHQANLLEHIVSGQRYYPGYFRVAFYGDFPAALRDKKFIYRGFEWEKYGAFCDRMLNKHSGAELIKSTHDPDDDIRNGSKQYIQCIGVVPEPDRTLPVFTNPDVPVAVKTYYEHSAIQLFSFSRAFTRVPTNGQEDLEDVWTEKTYLTTEESFPTVLRRSEVIQEEAVEISPVQNALTVIEQQMKDLTILEAKFSTLAKLDAAVSTNALSMALNEAVDAPANNGVPLYRETFLLGDYASQNPDQVPWVDKLRESIDELTRIIDRCIKLHGMMCPPEMLAFHETLEKFFRKNFYDEIQRLPGDGTSESIVNGHGGGIYDRVHPQPNGYSATPTLSLGRAAAPSLYAPSQSAGGRVSSDIDNNHTRHQRQTPLQKNLAHLARYGMTGLTNSLGDAGRSVRSGSPSGSNVTEQNIANLIHVGPTSPSIPGLASHDGSASFVTGTASRSGGPRGSGSMSRLARFGSLLRKS